MWAEMVKKHINRQPHFIYRISERIRLNTIAENTLTGTARNNSLGNISFLSSSVVQEPSTRLPPEEKGEIAELCAPITIQVNKITGAIPVVSDRVGTNG